MSSSRIFPHKIVNHHFMAKTKKKWKWTWVFRSKKNHVTEIAANRSTIQSRRGDAQLKTRPFISTYHKYHIFIIYAVRISKCPDFWRQFHRRPHKCNITIWWYANEIPCREKHTCWSYTWHLWGGSKQKRTEEEKKKVTHRIQQLKRNTLHVCIFSWFRPKTIDIYLHQYE